MIVFQLYTSPLVGSFYCPLVNPLYMYGKLLCSDFVLLMLLMQVLKVGGAQHACAHVPISVFLVRLLPVKGTAGTARTRWLLLFCEEQDDCQPEYSKYVL